jgi:hypothetical protein
MAHFAELDKNNTVLRIIVVHNNELLDENGNEQEALGIAFCENLFGSRWKQTSYNSNFRVRYAGQGYTYNEQYDAFIPPKPYPSWVLNTTRLHYEAPIPRPSDSNEDSMNPDERVYYDWDEELGNWVRV